MPYNFVTDSSSVKPQSECLPSFATRVGRGSRPNRSRAVISCSVIQ